ncbi:hypothetical protein SAMN05444337_0657 [Flavobacterium haoranii]|uniref:Rod shape-determining protein MreD n=1 Tax=Flavobacterium haoranii TaxID=683124 RepID=A0A1M6DIX3_9FLAO|nr:hypothetical protein SAMN05444337_0657 [Flavobacterium haoranii]
MNTLVLNIFRFLILLTLQILLFNNINLFGYINPYPYLLFVLLFPVNGNRFSLLFFSFLIGLSVDIFAESGGVHAFASTILAFVRPNLFRFSFGLSYEYQTIKIAENLSPERITFILLAIFIHHICLFFLEAFRFDLFFDVILKTLYTSIFTLIICLLIIYLIKPSKR